MGANVHYDTGPGGGVITYGPGDDAPLLKLSGGDNPIDTGTFYHQDGIGSVVAKTGTAIGTQRFDAWGVRPAIAPELFGYAGREAEPSGLYNMRARYYDPYMRRFIQRDPIGLAGGINQYAYAGNNPVNYRDPSGLAPVGPSNTTGTSYPSGGSGCTSQLMPGERYTETDAIAEIDGIDFSNGPVVLADGACLLNPQREILRASPDPRAGTFMDDSARGVLDAGLAIGAPELIGGKIAASFGGILSKVRGWFGAEAQAASGLPDATLVCRGGACKAENFLSGNGVTQAVGENNRSSNSGVRPSTVAWFGFPTCPSGVTRPPAARMSPAVVTPTWLFLNGWASSLTDAPARL